MSGIARTSSAAVRAWLSLIVQVAEDETQRGSNGSKAVRDAALRALGQLLAAVAGSPLPQQPGQTDRPQRAADALSFFLPGIAVGLCKALLGSASTCGWDASKAPAGAAAASSAAAVEALRALATLLLACLGNAAVEPALHGCQAETDVEGTCTAVDDIRLPDTHVQADDVGDAAVQQALDHLQMLSGQAKRTGCTAGSELPPRPPQQQLPIRQEQPMRVQRSAAWVHASARHLHELLVTALPPLLAHQRVAVREALVVGEQCVSHAAFVFGGLLLWHSVCSVGHAPR